MIRLPHRDLPSDAALELAALQREVDGLPSYAERRRAAIEQWPSRSQRKVFTIVRETLVGICSGPGRCMFCEDNCGCQIEHFRPKSIYPGLVFAWVNYLYACGQCNGPKGDRFAVFSDSSAVIDLSPCEVEPALGSPVLLDPRQDDPMEFLWLELRDTFLFKPKGARGTSDHERADYTIRWLGLNLRPDLVKAREVAYEDFRDRLEMYAQKKRDGADQDTLARRRDALLRKNHITVWREMQRQHEQIDELRAIFQYVPEALRW